MGKHVQISGLEELDRMASQIAPTRARALARSTVHTIAGQVRNRMRQRAPQANNVLRKAIISKRQRGTPLEAISDVIVTHGRGARHDAWYWHFVEFGTVKHRAQPFIRPTVQEITPRIPQIYRQEFGRRLERELERIARHQQT